MVERHPVLSDTLAAAPAPEAPAPPGRAALRLLRPALMIAVLVGAGLAARHLPGLSPELWLHRAALRHGPAGWAVFLILGGAICALGLPRQAVGFAAGLAYGVAGGTALALAANLIGCSIAFAFARAGARGWVRRLTGRWARLDGFVSASPFNAVLTLRLLPVGSSLAINLLSGACGIRFLPFFWATLLGSLPQTLIFVLLGSGVRIGHSVQIALGVALFVVSGALGLVLMRRARV